MRLVIAIRPRDPRRDLVRGDAETWLGQIDRSALAGSEMTASRRPLSS
jgi:hypothetical protein